VISLCIVASAIGVWAVSFGYTIGLRHGARLARYDAACSSCRHYGETCDACALPPEETGR
jgi:hypothetical protein